MKRRPVDPVVALILDNTTAAKRGARAAGCPPRDLRDIVQDAVVVALERHASGGFTLPDDERLAARIIGAFLHTTGRYLTHTRARTFGRFALPGVLPEPGTDPLPMLEARSQLYRLVADSGIHKLLESDATLEEYLCGSDVSDTTAGSRRYRLRHGATKR